jgi:hypothetical protein
MNTSRKWDVLPDAATIELARNALKANGFDVLYASSGEEARKKVFELLPAGAHVMTMTSRTLDTIGLTKEINESSRFDSARKKLDAMDRSKEHRDMQQLGAAPEWSIGSVHALTEDGHLLIASATGSQLAAEASGADQVVYVVGAQKIVRDIPEGLRRIGEYSFVLENERAKKAYGVPGSSLNKILIVNAEKYQWPSPVRSHVIIVNEVLGF